MSAIPIALAFALAAHAAPPGVPSDTLLSFACTESGGRGCREFEELAIHVNGLSGQQPRAETKSAAVAIATRYIAAGYTVDLGVWQINSRNLSHVGLTVGDAFDARASMRAGGKIISEAWDDCHGEGARTRQERAYALQCVASRYNTGSSRLGFHNGYVARFIQAAGQVASIRDLTPDFPAAAIDTSNGRVDRRQTGITPDITELPARPDCNARPEDVWGQAECRELTLHTDQKGSDQP